MTEDENSEDKGKCDICGSEFDWSRGGNVCSVDNEPVCDDHTDYVAMRQIHEETGREGISPLCTVCGKKLQDLPKSEWEDQLVAWGYES
jgi:hypothetical protein